MTIGDLDIDIECDLALWRVQVGIARREAEFKARTRHTASATINRSAGQFFRHLKPAKREAHAVITAA